MMVFNGKNGVWRTIGGRRIFIADGESLKTAMDSSGKFITLSKLNDKYKSILKYPIEVFRNREYSDDKKSKYIKTYHARTKK